MPGTTDHERVLVVDGHTFVVTQRPGEPGVHDFGWSSGPHPGYGFTGANSTGAAMGTDELVDSIRHFLAQVDPETGYIE